MELKYIPLSDADIRQELGSVPIIKYNELKQYKTISELLPNNNDAVVVFIQWSPNSIGHWVCCYKQNDKYYYFNPYGNAPDKDLNIISRSMRRILGEDVDEFRRLTGGKIEHSNKRFQRGEVDTCGRWIILRVNMVKMGFSQKQFNAYMKQLKDLHKPMSYDDIVCLYVPIGSQNNI